MGFLGTIIIARGIIVFVKQYKWYGLEELYVIWAKTIFGAFAYRLQNGPADVWFLVYWIPEFLIGNSYRVIEHFVFRLLMRFLTFCLCIRRELY